MKTILAILLLAVALGIGAGVVGYLPVSRHSATPPERILSQGPTLQQLERLSQLVTTRVHLADVLIGEGENCRGAWLIRGDALLGIDLAKARIVDRDDRSRRAALVLPPPQVLESRVDHERTRTWEVKQTTWVPWKRSNQDKLRDEVMQEAQKLIARAAGSPENLAHARTAAEVLLRGFYEEIGWQVPIRWETPPAASAP